MTIRLGAVSALVRYPVKSMRGESVDDIALGWHGLHGDRRLALRRTEDRGGFPWLTASRMPELLRFAPGRAAGADDAELPTLITAPDGVSYSTFDPALAEDIRQRSGSRVEMTHLNRGIFDESPISLISSASTRAVCEAAGLPVDARRFRPNIVLELDRSVPFAEDACVGQLLTFGDAADAPAVVVTHRDVRCAMVNLDPDTAETAPQLLRSLAASRDTCAGVYGTVVRPGRIRRGTEVFVSRQAER